MGIGPRIGLREVVRQGDSGLCEVDGLAILQAICIARNASSIGQCRARWFRIALVVADILLIGDIAILALGCDVEVQVMAVDGQGMGAILERVVVVARSQQVVVVGLRLAGHGDLAASTVIWLPVLSLFPDFFVRS